MTARQTSPSSDHSHSDNNVRKRVCKACDRCRLKKSKCDGGNPCGRCKADNAICVFGERKKAHDKVYPKGYVEMLEQQQAWLVHGLQEMYRRTSEGEGWPGEPLKCEPNGHPLTHDLLTRLGALDHHKGEHFEENPDVMQQDLWKQNAGHMQRQDSSDGSSEPAQSPVVPSRFSDAFSRPMPPSPSTFSPSSRTQGPTIKSEPQMTPNNPAFVAPLAMQGVVNPVALQAPQQWNNNFGGFDEMDLMATPDYSNFSFDDMSSPMFNRQIPMNCMVPSSYMDTKNDYEDISQFLNANAPEIAST
ncbi:Zn(II)2Cys6 transcription factor domain-containing protein [Aspergillus affinis]|uniref:Zn(II)2Cys6 transcription factor domain-containing protein n=1 Tax=Aspergillus affinis TaxID=1070780 RepID=UPI0022FE467B|nr:putative C6 transcription factor [Aspergillus affinis]KAI9040483.1 putative C6 transcription factor [Aspergillus affinis]